MIRGKCPICGKRFEAPSPEAWPGFPFCSERCRLIDLGRWIDSRYAIPGTETPGEGTSVRESGPEDEG
jgi:endogenous inhibitor of DNA gyrase (YacG/DUF329 family)